MAHRIEIALKDTVHDPRGERIRNEIEHFLHIPVKQVRSIDVYTVDMELSASELEKAAAGPFCDPVIQNYAIDRPMAKDFDFLVEVGFRPGVTDNVGRTAREAIEYITARPFQAGEGVYASVQYLFSGNLTTAGMERIATGLLCNTLIQRYQVLDHTTFMAQQGVRVYVPRITGHVADSRRDADNSVALQG